MKSYQVPYTINGDSMNRQHAQQALYDTMQTVRIQFQCISSSMMHAKQKDLLKRFVYDSGNHILKFHSAVCSRGDRLYELSVWKTIGLYCWGYSYRFYNRTVMRKQLLKILSKAIRKTKQLMAVLNRGGKTVIVAQNYLDLLLEYKYRVQAYD